MNKDNISSIFDRLDNPSNLPNYPVHCSNHLDTNGFGFMFTVNLYRSSHLHSTQQLDVKVNV